MFLLKLNELKSWPSRTNEVNLYFQMTFSLALSSSLLKFPNNEAGVSSRFSRAQYFSRRSIVSRRLETGYFTGTLAKLTKMLKIVWMSPIEMLFVDQQLYASGIASFCRSLFSSIGITLDLPQVDC